MIASLLVWGLKIGLVHMSPPLDPFYLDTRFCDSMTAFCPLFEIRYTPHVFALSWVPKKGDTSSDVRLQFKAPQASPDADAWAKTGV